MMVRLLEVMLRVWFDSVSCENGFRYFRTEDVCFEKLFYMLNVMCECKEITENIIMFLMLLQETV